MFGRELAQTDFIERAFFFLQTRLEKVEIEEIIDFVLKDTDSLNELKVHHCFVPEMEMYGHLNVGKDCVYCTEISQ